MCKGSNYIIKGKTATRISSHCLDTHFHNMMIRELEFMTLFKYFSFKNLSYVLKEKSLFLDRIQESWEDKYENFILKENIYVDDQPFNLNEISRGVFGQSWTTVPESDAIWRIYSPEKKGIRVSTTAIKLIFAVSVGDSWEYDTWFGRVAYCDLDSLNQLLKSQFTFNRDPGFLRSFVPYCEFLKRKEFEHEHEVRLIKVLDEDLSNKVKPYKRLQFAINPDEFIDNYMLDPRLNEDEYNKLRDKLLTLGVKKTKIYQSRLYSFTPIELRMQTQ